MFVSLLCRFFLVGKDTFHINSTYIPLYIYILHLHSTYTPHTFYIFHHISTYISHTFRIHLHAFHIDALLGSFGIIFVSRICKPQSAEKANSASCCHRGGLGRLRTAKAPSTALKILMSWRWVLLRCLVPIVPALVHFTPEVGSGACCNRRHPQRRQQRWGWESMAEVLKRCTRFCHRSTLWYYVYKKIW